MIIGKVALWLAGLGAILTFLLVSLGLANQLGDRVGSALVWAQLVLLCLWGGGCVYEAIKKGFHHC